MYLFLLLRYVDTIKSGLPSLSDLQLILSTKNNFQYKYRIINWKGCDSILITTAINVGVQPNCHNNMFYPG